MRRIGLNAPKCKCDYKKFVNDNECRNCVCYDKHESHLGTCYVGKGVDVVLMIECNCDGFKEGLSTSASIILGVSISSIAGSNAHKLKNQ